MSNIQVSQTKLNTILNWEGEEAYALLICPHSGPMFTVVSNVAELFGLTLNDVYDFASQTAGGTFEISGREFDHLVEIGIIPAHASKDIGLTLETVASIGILAQRPDVAYRLINSVRVKEAAPQPADCRPLSKDETIAQLNTTVHLCANKILELESLCIQRGKQIVQMEDEKDLLLVVVESLIDTFKGADLPEAARAAFEKLNAM